MATKPIRKIDYATAVMFLVTMVFALIVIVMKLFPAPAQEFKWPAGELSIKESPPIVQCHKATYFERAVLKQEDTTDHILCR